MPPRARGKQPPDLPAEAAVPSGPPTLGPVVGPAPPEPTPPTPTYTPPVAYSPPAAYSPPVVYSQYAVAPSRPYNPWAIVSICFAASTVIGTLCLGGLVAVITGHIARSQIKRSGEKGNSLALAGLIVGYISIGITLALIAAYILFFILLVAFAASHSGPTPTPTP